jgi:phosphoribosylformylglycinamidine (FGAM) synthase-like amidotransferase family enzyme
MHIIRYQDTSGSIHHAALQPDGSARRIAGDIFGHFSYTGETVVPHKLLAPIQPVNLLASV